ncbi:TetR/AcrR family transcriptional regulator [Devosia neptuniae]|jgi:AcrR family transcriptional regulator|uniref:TetR/AcrR family transcriptional regulator n=1 Tax=Devosia neptuniae TaxID=191302 RepID=UPI0022AF6585|nr:TetR/AcrR family transcriptional regulator [Devosia neptuniae]MCZ4346794.1 TetR/AcrR family transcriptional regulator [Devosia neptuniae]|tara:strand:+ start:1899 stop:2522 length:624 start_codon:yes stop_codon:yes gene_type:complete
MTQDSPPTRRESGDERRLAIAAAARDIIVEKGLEGLRTRDIAERVGINIATLHYHVPSKAELVALVAESIRHDFRVQAQRNSRQGKTALELLRLEFADFRETTLDMPELVIVLTVLTEKARIEPAIRDIMQPMYDHWRDEFAEIFARGIAEGMFRANLDPTSAALITTGALSDHWRKGFSTRFPLDLLIAELERAFIADPKLLEDHS